MAVGAALLFLLVARARALTAHATRLQALRDWAVASEALPVRSALTSLEIGERSKRASALRAALDETYDDLRTLEAAQDASEARGACTGYSRSRQRHRYLEAAGLKHRRLSSSGVVEDLKLFYAARPRPGNVIVDKSIIDARNLERKIVSHNKFDDHCWTTYRSSGPDRYCADAAVRSAADPYFDDEGALLDVATVTAELARSDLGAHFFDVNFGLFHQASNVSKTEMYFSITDRDDFRRWAEKYLLETLEAASRA